MTETKNSKTSACAFCTGKTCFSIIVRDAALPELSEAPDSCPMRTKADAIEKAKNVYSTESVREFARIASIQEAECYERREDGLHMINTRIEEIIQFADKCRYNKLGLAFCIGLREEARVTSRILETRGFEVASVGCKVGRVEKEEIGVEGDNKILGAALREPMCNPIAQAEVLNEEGVEFVVMLGLCVGHDTLFLQYCNIPCTVLAVKDRVTGHNPLAAIYLHKSPYYSRLKPGS